MPGPILLTDEYFGEINFGLCSEFRDALVHWISPSYNISYPLS